MKQLKIEIPNGYEIDQENSNLAEGVVKFKPKSRVPKSIDDVNGRHWYINGAGRIFHFEWKTATPNHFSTKKRAEAILALGQLIEIHAAIKQDKDTEYYFFSIESVDKNVVIDFWFETEELGEEFKSIHKQLIETVKKGL